MANNNSDQTNATYIYRLIFGNTITAPNTDITKLLLEQGLQKEVTEDNITYNLTLRGIKVNRKIYQPTEIEAELDIMQKTTDATGNTTTSIPSFEGVSALLLRRLVKIELVEVEQLVDTTHTIKYDNVIVVADNCYVYELNPQIKRDTNGLKMYVKLNIFSVDKLMTLNKYSKAYVARKLGVGILQPESLNFGTIESGAPLINSRVDCQRNLIYESNKEFIQPYLVQYNESFYDFMVRTSNRCGEFLYFEDGMLILGLPKSDKIVNITDFESVTLQGISPDPLVVQGFHRDSVKDDKGEISYLNHTVIDRDSTGFPNQAFAANISTNSELATDEYIFPLVKDKFSDVKREMYWSGHANDVALFQTTKIAKRLLSNTIDSYGGLIASILIAGIVDQGIQAGLSELNAKDANKKKNKKYIEDYDGKTEQSDGNKVVQFSSLAAAGWTTLSYYNQIYKYEERQQRKIICIDMGTTIMDVKLGQQITVDGLDGTYVVIQIQQVSEEAWNRNYDKYDTEVDDKYTGKRSLKIYAIPSYKKDKVDNGNVDDSEERFIPPVQPVPVIRKTGPQTAFVTDNEDPKFQGRVRIMYPWQSEGSFLKEELAEAEQKLKAAKTNVDELKKKQAELLAKQVQLKNYVEELKKYALATPEERETIVAEDQQITEMKAAAEEHDQKKSSATYNIDNDNTVIRKYLDEYDKTATEYRDSSAEIARAESEADQKTDERQKIVDAIQDTRMTVSTPWVRISTPMATPGGGTLFRPRVGDEVLVNFDCDNVERPYVVGSLYSKNNLTSDEGYYRKQAPQLQWSNISMAIESPNGHHISFTDPQYGGSFFTNLISPGLGFYGSVFGFNDFGEGAKDLAGGIHIGDRYGIYEIEMKSHKRAIDIKSPLGTISLSAFNGITISAPNGDVNIKGKNITLEAGNKITVNSGTNLKLPGCGEAPTKGNKAADVTKLIMQGIAETVVNDYVSSVIDLSLIRHVIEVFVRPVDGTLLLKSRKFLKLEAGLGNATIQRNQYKQSTKDQKTEEQLFYVALCACVNHVNIRVNSYLTTYDRLRRTFYTKRHAYTDLMKAIFKEDKLNNIPNMAKKAKDKQAANEANYEFTMDEYNSLVKDNIKEIFLHGDNNYTSDQQKFELIKPVAEKYYKAAYEIFDHCTTAKLSSKFADENPDMEWLKTAMTNTATQGWISDQLNKWKEVFSRDIEDPAIIPNNPEDPLRTDNAKYFRRAFILLYLKKVYDSADNTLNGKPGKYIYIGYNEADVTNAKKVPLDNDYWWKRQILVIDRWCQNSWLRTLWDSTVKKLLDDAYNNTIGMFKAQKDRQVWADGNYDGQILFSDKEDSTLRFEGEGLRRETDANQGNMAHLKWMLRDF